MNSTNMLLSKNYSIFNDYFDELFKCYNDYKKQWPFVADNFKSLDI